MGWGGAGQFGLDLMAGSDMPYFSQGAGLVSAGIYAYQGDTVGAASALGGMIPLAGTVSDAGRLGRWAAKLEEAAKQADNLPGPASNVVAKRTDTLQPGPFAKESIPSHRGRPTAEEQRQINDLMEKHGCHTCGTKYPGTKSGNAIADHQPPQALGEPEIFLPHCNHCKARQGGQVLQEIRRRTE